MLFNSIQFCASVEQVQNISQDSKENIHTRSKSCSSRDKYKLRKRIILDLFIFFIRNLKASNKLLKPFLRQTIVLEKLFLTQLNFSNRIFFYHHVTDDNTVWFSLFNGIYTSYRLFNAKILLICKCFIINHTYLFFQ